jgi:hypothetical protein
MLCRVDGIDIGSSTHSLLLVWTTLDCLQMHHMIVHRPRCQCCCGCHCIAAVLLCRYTAHADSAVRACARDALMSIVRGCPLLRGPALANMAVFLAAIPDDAVQVSYAVLRCAVQCCDVVWCAVLCCRVLRAVLPELCCDMQA